jgi:hypothetical protein
VSRNEILEIVTGFVDKFRNDTDSLSLFANHVKQIGCQLPSTVSTAEAVNNGDQSAVEELIHQSIDMEVDINNPDVVRYKGCGRNRRIVSSSEKHVQKRPKAPRQCRTCMNWVTDHDSRNCKKKSKLMKWKLT